MVVENFNCIIEQGDRQRGGDAGNLDSSGRLLHKILKEKVLKDVWEGEKVVT